MLLFYIDVNFFNFSRRLTMRTATRKLIRRFWRLPPGLRECLRKTDIIARVGGDEFAIMATEDAANLLQLSLSFGTEV